MSISVTRPTAERVAPRLRSGAGRWGAGAAAALTLATLILRYSQLHQSLFGDELWTYQQVAGHSLGQMLNAIQPGPENAPPLFFILAWAASKLGNPTVFIRLPSLLAGVATIPILYLLGREAVGTDPARRRAAQATGVLAAAIGAASPFALYYGLEARPYALMACGTALSTLALLRAVRTGRPGWWVLYALAADTAMYSHYTAVFVLAVQGAWSVWRMRERPLAPLAAGALAVLLYAPWLSHVQSRFLAIIAFLHPLGAANVGHDLVQVIPGYPLAPLHEIPSVPGLVVIGGCALLGLASLARQYATPAERPAGGSLSLIAAVALATPVGVLLYSLASTDIWDARDLYASAPAAAVLLAALLLATPRGVRPLAVFLVLGTLVVGTARAVSPNWTRPHFRAVAAYLDAHATPSDPVVMDPSYLSLDEVILPQTLHPHRVFYKPPRRWPTAPPGGAVLVVRDDHFDAGRHVPVGAPAAWALVARRHFGGYMPITVLTYRRRR